MLESHPTESLIFEQVKEILIMRLSDLQNDSAADQIKVHILTFNIPAVISSFGSPSGGNRVTFPNVGLPIRQPELIDHL